MIENILTIIFTIIVFIGICKWYANSCSNTEYEAWKTMDQAKYNWDEKQKID